MSFWNNTTEWKVGMRVAQVTGRDEDRINAYTIAKVYKNGRFVLEGSKQQYGVGGHSTARYGGYSRGLPLFPIDHPLVMQARQRRSVRHIREWVATLDAKTISESLLSELLELRQKATKPQEESK